MKKLYCDICGKKTKKFSQYCIFKIAVYGRKDIIFCPEICEKCIDKIYKNLDFEKLIKKAINSVNKESEVECK